MPIKLAIHGAARRMGRQIVVFVLLALLPCAAAGRAQTIVQDLFAMSLSPLRLTRVDGQSGAIVYSVPASSSHVRQGPDGLLYMMDKKADPATGVAVLSWSSFGGYGLDFGPDGNLYFGSSRAVFRSDATTGKPLGTFVQPGSGGLYLIDAVRFGPDGNLYVTEPRGRSGQRGRILRYNGTTGAFIDVFAIDPRLSSPRSLDWGPNGNLFVADFGEGDSRNAGAVFEFHGATGAFVRMVAEGLDTANGLAFGPDGNLYIGLWLTGTIKRYNGTTGAFIDDFATGLPRRMVGITWATFTVPEPTAVVQAAAAIWLLRRRRNCTQ